MMIIRITGLNVGHGGSQQARYLPLLVSREVFLFNSNFACSQWVMLLLDFI